MATKHNLFTYGTLMIPRIFELVTESLPVHEPADLIDYDCFRLKDRTYPGIIYKKEALTKGCLYYSLDEASFQRLDSFEGNSYDRKHVWVQTENGTKLEAFAYILKPYIESLLTTDRWSKENFEKHHLGQFMKCFPGF